MKLVYESLQELFESPDEISLPNLTYNRFGEPVNNDMFKSPHFSDSDARPFWYDDGIFHLGPAGQTHPDGIRKNGFFSGRVWTNKKLISFWEYPDAEDFLILIADLEKELGHSILGKKWKVEVLDGEWRQEDNFQTKLVSIKDYEGSEQRSKEDLGKEHIKSPLFKAKHVSQGFGSKNPAYQEKRAWQMASATSEGVADKYAEKAFHIPDEQTQFNISYQNRKSGGGVARVKGVTILKNPETLENFPKGIRGVIDKEGNLYIATDIASVIHVDILQALKEKGLIKSKPTGWEVMEETPNIDFITVQRIWDKNKFAIGESYVLPRPKYEEERKEALKFFEPFLEKAKKINPQYDFILEQVRAAARVNLKPGEYEQFKTSGS